jgi:cellulose synthase/poly-beta-1,6-N-acetylglucosamine synthase-like glycosyltransferase
MIFNGLNIFELVFWGSAFLVFYVYFGYPLVLWGLTRLFTVELKRDLTHTPMVSLMILAYNEEESIAKRIENALEMDYPADKLEVIVVSNGSVDRTDEIASGFAKRGVKLMSYKEPGKTRAQNLAIPRANGALIILSDADTFYHLDAIKRLVSYFVDSRTGLVCGRVGHVDSLDSIDEMVGKGERLYRGYDNILKILESKLGACIVASGCIIAFRKENYDRIDPSLTEDFVLPVRTLGKGFKNIFAPDAVAMEKVTEDGREEFGRKERTIIQGSRAFFSLLRELPLSKPLIVFEMFSHKFLRWLVGFFLVMAFVSNIFMLDHTLYGLFFVLQAVFYASAGLGYLLKDYKAKLKVRGLFIPYFFCLVNTAAISALVKMSFGVKLASWKKVGGTNIGN